MSPQLYSWDTETFLIAPGLQAPPLVCLQWAFDDEPEQIVHVRDPACKRTVVTALESGAMWNAQNAAFDLAVLMAQYPDLITPIFDLVGQDRSTCTIVRQKLCDIARGRFKVTSKRGYTLDMIARALHLDYLELNKEDPWRLKYGTLIDVPVCDWPAEARAYALKDVTAQRLVFRAQEAYAASRQIPLVDQYRQARAALWLRLMECRGMMVDPERAEQYIAEVKQTLAIDRETCLEAGLVRSNGTKDMLRAKVHMANVCREAEDEDLPLTEAGELAVEAFAEEHKLPLKGASWAWWYQLPENKRTMAGVSLNEDAIIHHGDELLESYQRYATSTTQLKRAERLYLAAKARKPIQASFGTLQDTGRTSCSQGDGKKPKPFPSAYGAQLQNPAKDKLVKRKPHEGWIVDPLDDMQVIHTTTGARAPREVFLRRGPRELYVAREGFDYCSTDYDAAELCAVAWVCKFKAVGWSVLLDVINDGRDPHTELAADLAGITSEEAYAWRKGEAGHELKKKMDDVFRQAAKVGNFGFWGLMGAAKLSLQARKQYGVILPVKQEDCADGQVSTTVLKEAFKTKWSEFPYFSKWVSNQLSGPYEDRKGDFVQFWSGRLRGGCWASALANTTFQGLVADIKKAACWRISEEMYTGRYYDGRPGVSPLVGGFLVNDVHDEPFSELVSSRSHEAAYRQAEIQVETANEIAPGVRWACKPAIMKRWYKSAAEVFDANGRLVPWEPKKKAV